MSTAVDELRAGLAYVEGELRRIHDEAGDEPLDDETAQRFEDGIAYVEKTREKIERETKRADLMRKVEAGELRVESSQPVNIAKKPSGDPFDLSQVMRWNGSPQEMQRDMRERARRVIGDDNSFEALEPRQREEAEQKLSSVKSDPASGYSVGEHIVRTSHPKYISAWAKMMTPHPELYLDEQERQILREVNQRAPALWGQPTFGHVRAASVGTDGSGGFLVPTILDPTVIFSGDGVANPFREISTIKSVINDNGWVGISSTGVTASWDTEGSEASDDAPTFVQPSVPVHKGVVFVPGSIEVFDDVPTLVGEIGTMILQAKDELEEAAFATGTGTNQPTGIVTALIGGPNYTAMATNSAFAVGDLFTAQEALGAAYQRRASWVMNNVHLNDIREFGGSNYYTRTVTLDSLALGEVLGKRTYESSTMSSTLDGDTNNNIVYGQFERNYVIADRIGLRTEFIPHLFATGNNRPSGQRGIYAYWRVGADSVNDTGFVLLYNPST